MGMLKTYGYTAILVGGSWLLAGCGSDKSGSLGIVPQESSQSRMVGKWSSCMRIDDGQSEKSFYELRPDQTWRWSMSGYENYNCKGAGNEYLWVEGSYSLGEEIILPSGINAIEFDSKILDSSRDGVGYGTSCYSIMLSLGPMLFAGNDTAEVDCTSEQQRNNTLNFSNPYVSDHPAQKFQDQDHVLNGIFDGCFTNAEFGTSRRYVTTQSNGIYDDFAEEYVGEQCQGDFTAEERYEGYYYTEGFAGTVEGYDYYDVVWVPAVLNAQSPEFNTCFSRVALRDDALYFMSDLEGEACKPYGERDELIPNYDQPMYRQPE